MDGDDRNISVKPCSVLEDQLQALSASTYVDSLFLIVQKKSLGRNFLTFFRAGIVRAHHHVTVVILGQLRGAIHR